jgi:NADPH:quinone reductase-like Zn-dependent oxidoreductase
MKAIVFNKFGKSDVLMVSEVPTPAPKKGEVLIKLSHTSVNPVDWKIREGYLQSMLPHVFPIIPGWDAVGEVAAVGEGVRAFKIGDRVFAYSRLPTVQNGTYAEYICLPDDFVALVPAGLKLEEAATVPLVALTAFQALTELLKIKKGDHLLITGGSGGVGSYAIQIAKALGAIVTTSTSTSNVEYVKGLGADHVIDYTKTSLKAGSKLVVPTGYDKVFDAVGGETLIEAGALVKDPVNLVSIVDTPAQGSFHFVYPNGSQLKSIAELISSGAVKIPAYAVRSVKDAPKVQDESASHRIRGKVVLKIDF